MEISWNDRVRNEVLHRDKEERNVGELHENFVIILVQHESSAARSFNLPITMTQVTAHATLNPT